MIGFVILNYRTYDDTEMLVNSLRDLEHGYTKDSLKVIIVDNETITNKLEVLKDKFLDYHFDIHYVCSDKNVGFASGMNLGISYALKLGCKFVVCSNNDILLPETFSFDILISKFYQYDNCCIIGPEILNLSKDMQNPLYVNDPFSPTKKNKFKASILLLPVIGRFMYIFRGIFKEYLCELPKSHNKEKYLSGEYFALHGSFFVLTPNYFKYFDELDPNTFLYFEELILAKRIQSVQGCSILTKDVYVIHKEDSATNSKFKNSKLKKIIFVLNENYKSLNYFLKKYII